MKHILITFGILAMSAGAFAQTPEETIEKALSAAPQQAREGATVIKWKADGTYDTLKKGANQLVCYDRSGEKGRAPFAVQCTSLANLDRVAQSRKIIAEAGDPKAAQVKLQELEKAGTRIKPEFGSVFISLNGPDRATARMHTTIAVPGATAASLGLPDNPRQGGAWLMDAGTSTAHIMTPGH